MLFASLKRNPGVTRFRLGGLREAVAAVLLSASAQTLKPLAKPVPAQGRGGFRIQFLECA